MNTTNPILRLESARNAIASLAAVAHAQVWIPSPDEVSEYASDGIAAAPTLEVILWRGDHDSHAVRARARELGLNCIGEGSNCLGPCYTFVAS